MAGVIMKDITPEGSIVPIYLDPTPKAQQEADALADAALEAEAEAKVQRKLAAQSKLAALGLTVEDLTALGL
jgi:hypothetical protein